MEGFTFIPTVDATQEFIEIANDFSNPLDIVREAISNSFDANATKIEIIFSTESDYGERNLVIRMYDDGEGMDELMLRAFFDLGNSTKRNDEEKIGEKGHGTKVYFNSSEIKVKTAKNGTFYEAVMEEPYKKLFARHLPDVKVEKREIENNEHFTEIIIKRYNKNESAKFTHENLKDYINWFTKFGSFENKFENNKYDGIKLYLKGLNRNQPEVLNFGHYFPTENKNVHKLFEKHDIAAPDYYCSWIKREGYLKNFPDIQYQIMISIEGNKVKQDYNDMIRRQRKQRIVGDYIVQDRYGLWLCKDFIPVQRRNEWIVSKGSEFTKFHGFINCQALKLTANRGSVENTSSEIMKDIEDIIRDLYDEIRESEDWDNISYLEAEAVGAKTINMEINEFKKRTENANKTNISMYKDVELIEPKSESGVFSLFIQISTLCPELFTFRVVDYNTYQGIDIIAVSKNDLEIKQAKKFYVEFKYKLTNIDFNHSFENTHSIVCWDTELKYDDEIKDIATKSRIMRITNPKNQNEYTKYFLDSDESQMKIEVFVLKQYLKEKLNISFTPRAKNQRI
ncbi:MAG: ATP-binding protein [bacterium]